MNEAQNKILALLAQQPIRNTTSELADSLKLSRSVTSHYLNDLVATKRIIKSIGRPVRWSLPQQDLQIDQQNPFTNFIGANGSLHKIIQQCSAAVTYPPKGLGLIITGNSGVGKSYLAQTIVDFARYKKVISKDSPYVVLNCADYANNPELLSSLLFGYIRGAYTGADKDKDGLLHQADGGYLFLDEIHRLSSENQEKLFSFIDSGIYYRMGDNKTKIKANVRLIFATTENPQNALLATFRRRIPLAVHLPDFSQRPLDERIALLRYLFLVEAKQTHKILHVSDKVVTALSQVSHNGNIGYLKNKIQVGCATANEIQANNSELQLELESFELSLIKDGPVLGSFDIRPEDTLVPLNNDSFSKTLQQLKTQITQNTLDPNQYHLREWKNILQGLKKLTGDTTYGDGLAYQHTLKYDRIICHQFGLQKDAKNYERLLYILYRRHFALEEKAIHELMQQLKLRIPHALHVARQFYRSLPKLNEFSQQTLIAILAILIEDYVDEDIQLRGLLVAHGESTATSIQAVVNSLCGTYVFDAIDMSIENGVSAIIDETNRLIDDLDTTNGFILMVDMGSLGQLYSAIKSHLDGDLLVVNNLTTITALDLGLQMQQQIPFKQIAEKADQQYTIDVQYYEGFSQTTNILISCISGSQVSDKIKEVMQPFMPNDIKVISLDYSALKEKIISKEWSYFDQTLFVMTTMDLGESIPFASMNIYNLLDATGTQQLNEWLSPYLSNSQLTQLNAEFLRFMSLEGISERLRFLNPDIVIKEVEDVIMKYENYYHLHLDGKIKLNLYMHIALMIERLMLRRPVNSEITLVDDQEDEFIRASKSIFQLIMMKYNIQISDYELSLMYELFKQFITV